MLRLVKTNLRNYVFSKFTVIAVVLLLGGTVLDYNPDSSDDGYLVKFFVFYSLFVVCAAVFIKSENDKRSGFYRNMLVAGCKRWQVFSAHVIASAIYGGAIYLTEAIIVCAATGSAEALLTCVAAYMFWSAAAACFSMLMDNILTALFAVLAAAAFMFGISSLVTEPLYETQYEYTYLDEYGRKDFVNGEFTVLDNPKYIGGAARVCLKTLAYLNPFAQMEYAKTAIKDVIGFDNDYYYNHKNKVPYMYELCFPLITLGLMAALTLGGCVFFRKKDLE